MCDGGVGCFCCWVDNGTDTDGGSFSGVSHGHTLHAAADAVDSNVVSRWPDFDVGSLFYFNCNLYKLILIKK